MSLVTHEGENQFKLFNHLGFLQDTILLYLQVQSKEQFILSW